MKLQLSKSLLKLSGIAMVVAVSLAGCGSTSSASPSTTQKPLLRATFLGGWGSAEKTDFEAILSYCQAHYNVKTSYQLASNVNAQLATEVQGGNAPDLAALSTPSSMQPFVAGGAMQPLSFLKKSMINADYAPFWRKLGTINGKLYAIYMKADVKSLVWYSPKKFSAGHYSIPKTWSAMLSLTKKMASQGKQPWAFGVGGSPSSPWTLTDLLENVVLQQQGPAFYQKWIDHKVSWTSPQLVQAFKTMNQIVANDKYIAGGRSKALGQAWDQAAVQVVNDPKAQFFQEATFVEAGLAGDLPKAKVGKDFSAFAFPMIRHRSTEPVEVGPNGIVMFKNTAGSRALVTCLADPKAQEKWAKLGGFISPNNNFPLSAYPDPILKKAASLMIKAGKANLLVGDASDLMPTALGSVYEFTALQRWFKNPSSYKSVLAQIETQAKRDYK